jgi:hypothetical protein
VLFGNFDQSASIGEVLIRVSDRTREGCSRAASWAMAPPIDMPTRWAAARL